MALILFLISLITRFLFLYFGYPSVTNDEADYFLNSYLLAKTGGDIFNNKFFLTSGILNATSGIPVYLGSLVFFVLGKSPVTGRLPYAVFNSLIPVLFYLVLNKLTKNKTLSFIGFIVINFSPWLSYLSSLSAIDAPTALVFYLAGFYVLLTNFKKNYKWIFSTLFFFLSFNSYMGIKTIFLFLVFIAFLSKRIYEGKRIKIDNVVKDLILSLLLFVSFFVLSWYSPSSAFFRSRLNEKILPINTNLISKTVDNLREISRGQKIIRYSLFNKPTVIINMFFERYIQAFNPYLLFVKGDSHPLYGTNYYGLFYLFDFILLIIGLIFFKDVFKNMWVAIPFFLLIIFTPFALGIMVDGATLSLRSYPSILGYGFFISCGIVYLLNKFVSNKKIIFGLVIFVYLLSFLHFFLTYLTIIRYMSGEQWHVNEKALVSKLDYLKNKTKKRIIVYVNGPRETLLLYLFYKNDDPILIKKILSENKLNIDNLFFSADCPQEKIFDSIQIMHSSRCPVNTRVFTPSIFVKPEMDLSSSYLLLN